MPHGYDDLGFPLPHGNEGGGTTPEASPAGTKVPIPGTNRYWIDTVDPVTGLPERKGPYTEPAAGGPAPAPGTGRPALTRDEVLAAVKADGGYIVNRGGVLLAVFSDGSIVKYDPAGSRGGITLYDPIYSLPSDAGKRMYAEAKRLGLKSGTVETLPMGTAWQSPDGAILLTADEIIAASEKQGVQLGEFMGSLRPSTSGLAARPGIPGLEGVDLQGGLPITRGGVYEQGGLEYIPAGRGANAPNIFEARGYTPAAAGAPERSIGYTERVSGLSGVLAAFGERSTGKPLEDFARAQQLQGAVNDAVARNLVAGMSAEQARNEAIIGVRNAVTLGNAPRRFGGEAQGIDLAGRPLYATATRDYATGHNFAGDYPQPGTPGGGPVRYVDRLRARENARVVGRTYQGDYILRAGNLGNEFVVSKEDYEKQLAERAGAYGGVPRETGIPYGFGDEATMAVGGGGEIGGLGTFALSGGAGSLSSTNLPLGRTGAEAAVGTYSFQHGGSVEVDEPDDRPRRPRPPDDIVQPAPWDVQYPEQAVMAQRAREDRDYQATFAPRYQLAGLQMPTEIELPMPTVLRQGDIEGRQQVVGLGPQAPPPPALGVRYVQPRLENQIAELQRKISMAGVSVDARERAEQKGDFIQRMERQVEELRRILRLTYTWLPQDTAEFAGGGQMVANEEIIGYGRFTGKPYFRLGEGMPYKGRPEMLTIEPLPLGKRQMAGRAA